MGVTDPDVNLFLLPVSSLHALRPFQELFKFNTIYAAHINGHT